MVLMLERPTPPPADAGLTVKVYCPRCGDPRPLLEQRPGVVVIRHGKSEIAIPVAPGQRVAVKCRCGHRFALDAARLT